MHICSMKKRENCLYVYFLNAILLTFFNHLLYFFTSIERVNDFERNDINSKKVIVFYSYKNVE